MLHPGQGACQKIAPNHPEPWCSPCCPSRRRRINTERSEHWAFVYSINLLPQEWDKLSRFPALLAGLNFGNDQAIASLLKLFDLVCRGFASASLSCCQAGAAVGWLLCPVGSGERMAARYRQWLELWGLLLTAAEHYPACSATALLWLAWVFTSIVWACLLLETSVLVSWLPLSPQLFMLCLVVISNFSMGHRSLCKTSFLLHTTYTFPFFCPMKGTKRDAGEAKGTPGRVFSLLNPSVGTAGFWQAAAAWLSKGREIWSADLKSLAGSRLLPWVPLRHLLMKRNPS